MDALDPLRRQDQPTRGCGGVDCGRRQRLGLADLQRRSLQLSADDQLAVSHAERPPADRLHRRESRGGLLRRRPSGRLCRVGGQPTDGSGPTRIRLRRRRWWDQCRDGNLGQYVYSATKGSVHSKEALANPFSSSLTFTHNMLRFPPLAGWITDTHFDTRSRFGRLTSFMARQIADGTVSGPTPQVYVVGVDEDDAVVVDKTGKAKLLQSPSGSGAAYFLVGGPARQVKAGEPLIYPNLKVTRLDSSQKYFDLTKRCGTGPTYTVSVDASGSNPFGAVDPYSARGAASSCP